jgi:hypothetical protein
MSFKSENRFHSSLLFIGYQAIFCTWYGGGGAKSDKASPSSVDDGMSGAVPIIPHLLLWRWQNISYLFFHSHLVKATTDILVLWKARKDCTYWMNISISRRTQAKSFRIILSFLAGLIVGGQCSWLQFFVGFLILSRQNVCGGHYFT